jgi:uncharacterized protein
MKDTLHTIVASLVQNTDAIVIDETVDNDTITFVVTVAPEDMGKIIGKEGKVIRALRNVMKIPAMKQNKRIQINLNEQEKPQEA